MAEYASDLIAEVDFNVATKDVGVAFKLGSEAHVSRTQANDLRTAYLSGGWSNMRAAWATIDSRSTAWLDGMSNAEQAALVYQVSARSALPQPP